MKGYLLAIVLIASCQLSYCQFFDDFSDGDLLGWQGDAGHFVVNAQGQLQLNAPSGSTASSLHTNVAYADSMQWELYVKLAFAPSTSNQLRIYLGLTEWDFSAATGYFLEIGAGGDMDALELKYLENGTTHAIASSVPGLVSSDPVELKIRVIRDSSGRWSCFDIRGTSPVLLFSTLHDLVSLTSLNTFGLHCRYTDTRRDKFFFDDILIDRIRPDTLPPSVTSLTVTDDHSLLITLSEAPDDVVASDPLHYVLSPGNVFPSMVNISGQEILLSWSSPFESLVDYTLTISGIPDLAGNVLLTSQHLFQYIQIDRAHLFELLLTEIMVDPTPVVDLPDAEYVELFNASHKVFDLSDYKLRVGTSDRDLPDSLVLPGEYVIIADDGNANALSVLGRVIVLASLPALANSGTYIAIRDEEGNIIHDLTYSESWYQDDSKSSGGWSIEMINPLHVCEGAANWRASSDPAGGTPGRQNSVWESIPDDKGPRLLSLFTGTQGTIELRFNERIDSDLMLSPATYRISEGVEVHAVQVINSTSLSLTLQDPLAVGITYLLYPFEAYDCIGNVILTDTVIFGLVVPPSPGDVLINEILFNPESGGSRYIEIMNVSDKFIDLSAMSVARLSTNHIFQTGIQEIMAPEALIALSPDPADILSRYTVPRPDRLFKASLPAWSDRSDDVAILAGGTVIDSFTYSSEWHHPVIADQNGVSLERISLHAATFSSSNWHSASSIVGFGTPTAPNSQMAVTGESSAPFIIGNKHFSPDNDGFKDFLTLTFEPESSGHVATIWVYDLEGREIHQLLSNEILGAHTLVQWDGRNFEGFQAEMGIYLIFIQMWAPDGKVSQYRETCALVKR